VLSQWLGRIVDSKLFQRGILGTIVVAGVLVGLETYPSVVARYGDILRVLDRVIVGIFVLEAAAKIGRHGRRPWLYFKDPWNVFDFVVVALCLIPADFHYAAVLRLARILRTLRLISAVPRLQLVVTSLIKSMPSMAYVGGLLFLLFYVYGVLGVFLWQGNDPAHFGNLKLSMLSLFRVVTLEDWSDVMYIQMYGADVYPAAGTPSMGPEPAGRPLLAVVYFVSFVLVGTMIMLNLFIGVIVSSMNEAQAEQTYPEAPTGAAAQGREVEAIERQLAELQARLASLRASGAFGAARSSPD
jgi:voltage-gated sodium channel